MNVRTRWIKRITVRPKDKRVNEVITEGTSEVLQQLKNTSIKFMELTQKTPDKSKYCSGCSSDLPTSSFSKNASRPDGLQNYCVGCRRRQRRGYAVNRQSRQKRLTRERKARQEQRENARTLKLQIESPTLSLVYRKNSPSGYVGFIKRVPGELNRYYMAMGAMGLSYAEVKEVAELLRKLDSEINKEHGSTGT